MARLHADRLMRCLFLAVALAASHAVAAPVEVWLSKERAAQLKAITSRPYVSKRTDIGDGTERLEWRNGKTRPFRAKALTSFFTHRCIH